MATFSGTSGPDTITPQAVSSGVEAVPAESRPSAARDVINGLAGGDVLAGGGGNDTIYGGLNGNGEIQWTEWKVESGGNGHWYALWTFPSNISWEDANKAASSLGTDVHLATVTSEEENALLLSIAGDYPPNAFLGGFQPQGSPEPDEGWRWVTSETFLYTKWMGGEPNQHLGIDEDYLEICTNFANTSEYGQWNDSPFHTSDVFIEAEKGVPETGPDILHGNSGDDLIYGGRSRDDRADGPDTIYGDAGNDTVWAGGGDDVVYGGTGQDKLYGQSDNDRIYGGGDRDWLGGGTGNDHLYGQGGRDILSGREGSDRLSGGGGNDRYDYDDLADSSPGVANRDVILDFGGVGETRGDRIDLSAIDAITSKSGNQAFDFIGTGYFNAAGQVRVVASGGYTLVQANTDGTLDAPELEILVKDGSAAPGQWEAEDFIL